jgi:hypothetical protein
MQKVPFELSETPHTWFIDLDGTILRHRVRVDGFLTGTNELLPGAKEFWKSIPDEDCIVIATARWEEDKQDIIDFFKSEGLRYDHILVGLKKGERIVINDKKTDGSNTAFGWNVERNAGFE